MRRAKSSEDFAEGPSEGPSPTRNRSARMTDLKTLFAPYATATASFEAETVRRALTDPERLHFRKSVRNIQRGGAVSQHRRLDGCFVDTGRLRFNDDTCIPQHLGAGFALAREDNRRRWHSFRLGAQDRNGNPRL